MPQPSGWGHAELVEASPHLDETAFRYNNRENPLLFRDTLMALIGAEAMPYQELIRKRVSKSSLDRDCAIMT